MEIRQTSGWANYMKALNWEVEKIGQTQLFIRRVPFLNFSFIKIQHPKNPLPLKEIDKIAKSKNAFAVLLEPSLENYDEKMLIKAGYQNLGIPMAHSSSIQIDLTPSLDKIFKSFSENARRNIKKALNYNLKIKIFPYQEDQSGEKFSEFLKLLKNLTEIKKFWVPDDNEMRKKIAGLKDSYIFFAYEKTSDKPIATVWLSLTKNSSHYIQTGITQRGYELLANYQLVWEIVKFSKKHKLKYFDFEGIFDPRYPKNNIKWKNFTEFKKRFHGNLVVYPQPRTKFYNFFFKFFYLLGKYIPQ